MYVNKIENRVKFKIKNGYYLERSTQETMKLLGSTEIKITKGKNGENVPHFELVFIHCNLITIIISKILECYIHLFQTIRLVVY